jgi:hypothetical protein
MKTAKSFLRGGCVRDGLLIDEWPEVRNLVAQPEKENLILNQNEPTIIRYAYLMLLSSIEKRFLLTFGFYVQALNKLSPMERAST